MHQAPAMDDGRTRNRLRPWIWGGAVGLLALPAIAMRWFPASGVDWRAGDFVAMGALLAIAAGLYELGARSSASVAYRAGFGLAVLTGFLTVWVNLAVGMLGEEGSPPNLMFVAVLLLAGAGALATRLRPAGMARAMAMAGNAQLLVVALAAALGDYRGIELVLSGCFALPWFASALLFRHAASHRG